MDPAQMRDLAAAEHSVHWLLAKDGARTVYPKLAHTSGFAQVKEAVKYVQQIADRLAVDAV